MTPARFDRVRPIADAVMYEGYVLYPYRASAMKNQFRWQFGVIAPPEYAVRETGETASMQTECLVEATPDARICVTIRCLQLQRRSVEEMVAPGEWRRCRETSVDGRHLVEWDEAVEREIDCDGLVLGALCRSAQLVTFALPAGRDLELVHDGRGEPRARLVRERLPVTAVVRIGAETGAACAKVRVRIENATPIDPGSPDRYAREQALRQSLLAAHALLAVEGGQFVSLIDPPAELAAAAASCRNERTWPVLVGPAGCRDMMLSAPIILYDYPAVAPESRGDFFDATEIDELLALRVATMTEPEKAAAAATDGRAGEIVRRTATHSRGDLARLHGARRDRTDVADDLSSWEALLNPAGEPSPALATVAIGDTVVSAGSRVRLQPRRSADAMDMFLAGRRATVTGIFRDLDDRTHVAVTLDDDPGADLHHVFGRYMYFGADEIIPCPTEPADAAQ